MPGPSFGGTRSSLFDGIEDHNQVLNQAFNNVPVASNRTVGLNAVANTGNLANNTVDPDNNVEQINSRTNNPNNDLVI